MACNGDSLDTTSLIKWKDTLNCPVCLKVYTTPRVLACLHTFCEECIQVHITKLTENSGVSEQICCPVCRVFTPPPDRKKRPFEWANLLPMNYAILPILETINTNQTPERYCDSCRDGNKSVPAVKFCSDCQQCICEDCLDCHKQYRRLQNHSMSELVGLSTYINTQRPVVNVDVCELHPDEAIKYFCEDHNMLLCSSCVIVSHRPCRSVTGIHEMGETLKQGSDFQRLQTELKGAGPIFKEITNAINVNMAEIEAEANRLPARVTQLQTKAIAVFEGLYSKVVAQCDTLKKEHTLKLSDEVFNSESAAAAIKSSLIMLDDVKENGSNSQLFITVHKTEKQMTNYTEILDKLISNVTFAHLELQLDKELQLVVGKSCHTVNVEASLFTPAAIETITRDRPTHSDRGTAVVKLHKELTRIEATHAQYDNKLTPKANLPYLEPQLNKGNERVVEKTSHTVNVEASPITPAVKTPIPRDRPTDRGTEVIKPHPDNTVHGDSQVSHRNMESTEELTTKEQDDGNLKLNVNLLPQLNKKKKRVVDKSSHTVNVEASPITLDRETEDSKLHTDCKLRKDARASPLMTPAETEDSKLLKDGKLHKDARTSPSMTSAETEDAKLHKDGKLRKDARTSPSMTSAETEDSKLHNNGKLRKDARASPSMTSAPIPNPTSSPETTDKPSPKKQDGWCTI